MLSINLPIKMLANLYLMNKLKYLKQKTTVKIKVKQTCTVLMI